jgi:hypothetical protein
MEALKREQERLAKAEEARRAQEQALAEMIRQVTCTGHVPMIPWYIVPCVFCVDV